MARPCIRRNIGGAPINDSNILVSIPAISRISTLTPASTLDPPESYTNKDLHKANKLVPKSFVKG